MGTFGPNAYPEWHDLWVTLFWLGFALAAMGGVWFLVENCPMPRGLRSKLKSSSLLPVAATNNVARRDGLIISGNYIHDNGGDGIRINEGVDALIDGDAVGMKR